MASISVLRWVTSSGGLALGAGRPLDLREEVLPPPPEVLVAEPPELAGLRLQLVVDAEGVGELHLPEAVEVELPDEGGELVVLEELGDYHRLEEVRVLDYEGEPVFRPAADFRVARVDHVIGLL